jgi:tRNA 2-thiouridine synthesizing protein A
MNQVDGIRTETLLADVGRLAGAACPGCGAALDARGILAAIWLGFRHAPRCPRCVAAGLGRDPEEFFTHVRDAMLRRDCFREAWETVVERVERTTTARGESRVDSATGTPPPRHDEEWDAGDLGCGDLVLELRLKLRAMAPGRVLKLTALDLGAPEDLPAWCGLVGHRLVSAAHPTYFIRRKDD